MRRATAYLSATVSTGGQPLGEDTGQHVETGRLPAHEEERLRHAWAPWGHSLVSCARFPRFNGIVEDPYTADADHVCHARLDLGAGETTDVSGEVLHRIEDAVSFDDCGSDAVDFRVEQVGAVRRRMHPLVLDFFRR